MSFKRALAFIFISVFMVSGTAVGVFWYLQEIQNKKEHNPQFTIVALAQSTQSGEPLKSAYLAELLGLSTDQPQNLYQFNSREAMQRLLESALIKTGSITKIKPGTLLIEYEGRQPVAFSGDFTNTAIDKDGFLIPFKPFFTPKKLPNLILGEQEEEQGKWGKPMQSSKAKLALDAFRTLQNAIIGEPLQLIQLDVSRAHSLSFGQREIIVLMEEKKEDEKKLSVTPIYLRMSPHNYRQEFANFLAMRSQLVRESEGEKVEEIKGRVQNKPLLIELRVPQLAFVTSLTK